VEKVEAAMLSEERSRVQRHILALDIAMDGQLYWMRVKMNCIVKEWINTYRET
jgi:hypothetical protein